MSNNMRLGVNARFFLQDRMSDDNHDDAVIDKMAELGVTDIRIPIPWARLQPQPAKSLDSNFLEKYCRFIETLPKNIVLLGCILGPPARVAEEYFENQSLIGDQLSEFCSLCVDAFPAIRDWEIWNEPNASDFYLSVRTEAGHRPWTAAEFVAHILIPGAKAIRGKNPHVTICAGSFAEDGVAGHTDRQPALSNCLPHDGVYKQFRGKGPHDHFYFAPNFTADFLTALEQMLKSGGESKLIDAFGFHPYPYFNLHRREDKSLSRATSKHINDFFSVFNTSAFSEAEVWVTEIGARSLDIKSHHFNSEEQQEAFLQHAHRQLSLQRRVTRLYWYKFVDRFWDLFREKTFGLCDYALSPRKVFYTYKKLQRETDTLNRLRFVDSFEYGVTLGKEGFDPSDWAVKARTIFAYSTGLRDREVGACALVSPGRNEQDWIEFLIKRPFRAGRQSIVRIKADIALAIPEQSFRLITHLSDAERPGWDRRLEIDTSSGLVVTIRAGDAGQRSNIRSSLANIRNIGKCSGLKLEMAERFIRVWLQFGSYSLFREFSIQQIPLPPSATLKFRVVKTNSKPLLLKFSKVEVDVLQEDLSSESIPSDFLLDANDWFLLAPSYSQIRQDDWVMRATHFRRGGYFAEIGGHDGVSNSNTFLLERDLDWNGVIVEANPRWHREICKNRRCVAINAAAFSTPSNDLQFVDAGAVGGLISHLQDDIHAQKRAIRIKNGAVLSVPGMRVDEILERAGAPTLIDYISIDTEGSEIEVLKSIDFRRWKICLITVEHAGNQQKRSEAFTLLKPHGFDRTRIWFEDWFVNYQHLAEALGVSIDDVRSNFENVWRTEPYIHRSELIKAGINARKRGDRETALSYFLEAGKSYYPDPVHARVEQLNELVELKHINKAVAYLEKSLAHTPNNPKLQRLAIIIYAKGGRLVKLARLLRAGGERSRAMLKDREVKKAFTGAISSAANRSLPKGHDNALEAIKKWAIEHQVKI